MDVCLLSIWSNKLKLDTSGRSGACLRQNEFSQKQPSSESCPPAHLGWNMEMGTKTKTVPLCKLVHCPEIEFPRTQDTSWRFRECFHRSPVKAYYRASIRETAGLSFVSEVALKQWQCVHPFPAGSRVQYLTAKVFPSVLYYQHIKILGKRGGAGNRASLELQLLGLSHY